MTFKLISTFKEEEPGSYYTICYIDDKTFLSSSSRSVITIWKDLQPTSKINLNYNTINSICKYNSEIFLAAMSYSVQVYKNFELNNTLKTDNFSSVDSICLLNEDTFASICSNKIYIWKNFVNVSVIISHENYNIIKIDDYYFATSSKDRCVQIWNIETSECTSKISNISSNYFPLCMISKDKIVTVNEECLLTVEKSYYQLKQFLLEIKISEEVKLSSSKFESVSYYISFVDNQIVYKNFDSKEIIFRINLSFVISSYKTLINNSVLVYTLDEKIIYIDLSTYKKFILSIRINNTEFKNIPYEISNYEDLDKCINNIKLSKLNIQKGKNLSSKIFSITDSHELKLFTPRSFGIKSSNVINDEYDFIYDYNSHDRKEVRLVCKHSKYTFIVCFDSVLEIWNLLSKSCVTRLTIKDKICCVAPLTEDILLIGSYRRIYIWSLDERREIYELDTDSMTEVLAIYALDRSNFISIDSDNNISSWEIKENSFKKS
jgi:hypothetical protein